MGAFFISLLWSVVISLVARAVFEPDSASQDPTAANTMGDVDAPTIDEGTVVPLIYGSMLTGRQNVSWYGGLVSSPIEQGGYVTGYHYSISAQLSLCLGPITAIREIRCNDVVIPAANMTVTESTDYWDYVIDAPELMGGDKKEGGISGEMRVYKGTSTQTSDPELTTLVNSLIPAYRDIAYAFMQQMYIGTSTRLPAVSFLVERFPTIPTLSDTYKIIGTNRDANPVAVIYDLMTRELGGAGVPDDQFATASWLAAAATCHGEGLGVSLTISSASDLDSVVQSLLKYIDGVIYDDPATGLIDIKLVREADLESAALLTTAEVSRVTVSRMSWTELSSTVKVTYTDPSRNWETGGVMAQNSALVQSLGGAVTLESYDSPGFTDSAVAQSSAERLLRTLSYPLSKVEVTGNRALAALRAGAPFRLQWSRPSIDAYYRVTQISYGDSLDGTITVSGVEDTFAAAANTFTPPGGSGWSSDGAAAQPITRSLLIEMPYRLRQVSARSVIYGAQAPSIAHTGFYVDGTLYTFMSVAPLTSSIAQWTGATLTSLTLATTAAADVITPTSTEYDAGDALLLVGGELMAYRTVTRSSGTITFGTLARGVLDTVPRAWPSGTQVVILKTARVRQLLDLTSDSTVTVSARTATADDVQTEEEATVSSLTTASRALRPAPPGALTVGGTLWGAGPHAAGVTVSWAPRTRLDNLLRLQTDTGLTAEAGTDYVLRVYSSDGTTLLQTYTTSSTSQAIAETGTLSITLHARRDGLESYQGHRLAISVTAPPSNLLLESGDNLLLEA